MRNKNKRDGSDTGWRKREQMLLDSVGLLWSRDFAKATGHGSKHKSVGDGGRDRKGKKRVERDSF